VSTGPDDFEARAYWEERLRVRPGVEGVGSLDYGKSYNRWLYKVRRRVFSRLVRSLQIDLRSARVLDVGSGTGFYLELWRRMGVRDLTGSDMTNSAVDALRHRFDVPIEQLDITERSDLEPFDVVSVVDVLFHIVDDGGYEAAFANLARLVKPGGVLVFSEHLPHSGTLRAPHRVSRAIDDVLETATRAGFVDFVRGPMFVLMEHPIDPTPGRGQLLRWKVINRLARNETAGFLAGLALFPLELVLTRFARESPSTEFVVCRRPSP